jgi:hypothetical protein
MCLGGSRQAAAPVQRIGGYNKDHYNGNIFDPKPAEAIKDSDPLMTKAIKTSNKLKEENNKAKLKSGLAKNNYASNMNQSGLTIT